MRKLLLSSFFAFFILQTATAQCTTSTREGVHVVQYGETLFRISKLYGVTIDNLRDWNGMKFNEILSVCQELQILPNTTQTAAAPIVSEVTTYSAPVSEVTTYSAPVETFVTRTVPTTTTRTYTAPATATTSPYNSYQRQAGGKHVIQQGESIANIARLYGYTEERFREFNVLKLGQELTPGSVVLSTDCSCDRVSYSEQSRGLFQGQWNDRLIPQHENAYYHKRYNNNGTTTYTTPSSTSGSYNNQYYTPPSSNTNTPSQRPTYNNGAATAWGQVNSPSPSTQTNNWNRNNDQPSANQTNNWNRNNNQPTTNTNRNTPAPYNNSSGGYSTAEENEMVKEINLLRSNPAGYIPYVEQYIRDIKSGKAFGSSTTAAYELIDELKRTPPLSILQTTDCLYQAARKHGEEAVRKGSSDHQGIDGSWPWDRVKRSCANMQDGNENLVGGPSNIREAVMLLLVDDGISNRGHRKTLLNKDWKYVACYKSGKVGQMPNSWVQLFGY